MKILLIRTICSGLLVVQSFFIGGANVFALADEEASLIDDEYKFRLFPIDVLRDFDDDVSQGQELIDKQTAKGESPKKNTTTKAIVKKIPIVRKSPEVLSRDMKVVVTAYSSTLDQTDATPCITANGFNVCDHNKENVIAANFLPFGTKVRLPELFGEKVFTVQDRMHRRHQHRVDLWMKTRKKAKQFGIRRTLLEVVPEQVAIK